MKATLNLRFNKTIINDAKEYARRHRTSLSAIVETYLAQLVRAGDKKQFISDDLIGILKKYKGFF